MVKAFWRVAVWRRMNLSKYFRPDVSPQSGDSVRSQFVSVSVFTEHLRRGFSCSRSSYSPRSQRPLATNGRQQKKKKKKKTLPRSWLAGCSQKKLQIHGTQQFSILFVVVFKWLIAAPTLKSPLRKPTLTFRPNWQETFCAEPVFTVWLCCHFNIAQGKTTASSFPSCVWLLVVRVFFPLNNTTEKKTQPDDFFFYPFVCKGILCPQPKGRTSKRRKAELVCGLTNTKVLHLRSRIGVNYLQASGATSAIRDAKCTISGFTIKFKSHRPPKQRYVARLKTHTEKWSWSELLFVYATELPDQLLNNLTLKWKRQVLLCSTSLQNVFKILQRVVEGRRSFKLLFHYTWCRICLLVLTCCCV